MRSRTLVLLAALALSAACAPSYQQLVERGGLVVHEAGAEHVTVAARGDGATSDERLSDYALLRAAEAAHERGYDRFRIAKRADFADDYSYTSIGNWITITSDNGETIPIYIPPTTTWVHQPRTTLLVELMAGADADGTGVYDTEAVLAELGARYDVAEAPR